MTRLSKTEVTALFDDLHEEQWDDEAGIHQALEIMNMWLERGDGIAIYRNQDLGHPEVGHVKFVSFGSKQAQIEADEPPARLPDFGDWINWRYRLEATYRGDKIEWSA